MTGCHHKDILAPSTLLPPVRSEDDGVWAQVCVCAHACIRARTSATRGLSPLPNNEESGIIPIELLMEKLPGWTAQATLLLPCWETALSDHSLTVPRLRQKPWVKGSALVQHSHRLLQS